jgi:hypothetical protein
LFYVNHCWKIWLYYKLLKYLKANVFGKKIWNYKKIKMPSDKMIGERWIINSLWGHFPLGYIIEIEFSRLQLKIWVGIFFYLIKKWLVNWLMNWLVIQLFSRPLSRFISRLQGEMIVCRHSSAIGKFQEEKQKNKNFFFRFFFLFFYRNNEKKTYFTSVSFFY